MANSGKPPGGDTLSPDQASPGNKERWKELAQSAVNESDPEKLMNLVADLIAEWDRAHKLPD